MFLLLLSASLVNIILSIVFLIREVAYGYWGAISSFDVFITSVPIKISFLFLMILIPSAQALLWYFSRRNLRNDDRAYYLKILTIIHIALAAPYILVRPDIIIFILTDIAYLIGVKPQRHYNIVPVFLIIAGVYAMVLIWFFFLVSGIGLLSTFSIMSDMQQTDVNQAAARWILVLQSFLFFITCVLPLPQSILAFIVGIKNISRVNLKHIKFLKVLTIVIMVFCVCTGLLWPHLFAYLLPCIFILLAIRNIKKRALQ